MIVPTLLKLGCKHFFVSNCDEGRKLRLITGNKTNIYVLHGIFLDELKIFVYHNLIPVLNNLRQIHIWQNYANSLNLQLPCLIHIDTGMHRLGIQEAELKQLNLDIHTKNLNILYIISHLIASVNIQSSNNDIQLKLFKKLSKKFINSSKSLANSSGVFLGPSYHFELVRVGAAIYGINPTPYMNHSVIKPVASLYAPIIQINSLPPQKTVGYHGIYTNTSKTSRTIATIPIGYVDGFLQNFSKKGYVMISGYKAPIIGAISMDLTIIDVSEVPKHLTFLEQKVELLGTDLPIDKLATLHDTSEYKILASLGLQKYKRYIIE